MRWWMPWVVVSVLASGCTTVEPDAPVDDPVKRPNLEEDLRTKIVNGRVERGFPAVGALELGGGGLCTGTVIADRWVITAAHCFPNGFEGGNLVLGDSVFAANARRVRLQRVVRHPRYDAQSNNNDIALVELAQGAGVAPMAVAQDLNGITGQTLKWVGYGITSGDGQDSGVKRSVALTVTRLHATRIESQEAGRNACRGDSGGPAFRIVGDAAEVAGVTSYGDQDCLELTVNTRVDAFLDFLAQTMGQAQPGGADPAPADPAPADPAPADPAPADPGGIGCAALLDCVTRCADDQCVQQCGAQASEAAIEQYNAIAMCAEAAGCADWACVEQRCGAQMAACGAPVAPAPQPEQPPEAAAPAGGGCGALLSCSQRCGPSRDCLRACAADAAPASVAAYGRLTQCAAEWDCLTMQCVGEACGAELNACTGGQPEAAPEQPDAQAPVQGGLACSEIYICFQSCGSADCDEACYRRGSAQAQSQVAQLDDCVFESGCDDMDCVEARCGGPLQACFGW